MKPEGRKTETAAHHEDIISEVFDQMKIIFEKSEQPIYLYLDDAHKVCNQKFATMLGYKSAQEWAETKDPFMKSVANNTQQSLMSAYNKAMTKLIASTIKVTWNKKSGDTIDTTVALVPIAYKGHILAMHYVSTET